MTWPTTSTRCYTLWWLALASSSLITGLDLELNEIRIGWNKHWTCKNVSARRCKRRSQLGVISAHWLAAAAICCLTTWLGDLFKELRGVNRTTTWEERYRCVNLISWSNCPYLTMDKIMPDKILPDCCSRRNSSQPFSHAALHKIAAVNRHHLCPQQSRVVETSSIFDN